MATAAHSPIIPDRGHRFLHLDAPLFVPSVSTTAKSDLSAVAHIQALVEWRAPSFLVSAYDLHHMSLADRSRVVDSLESSLTLGVLVFIDSGLYEARWLRDDSWRIEHYHDVLSETPHSVAFTFDSDELSAASSLATTAHYLGSASSLIPIVHGDPSTIGVAVADVVQESIAAVAVTERDLGDSLDSVATSLRSVVRSVSGRVPLHVLGAGCPRSILLYATAGATSFDGLAWCRAVADPDTGTLHHAKHLPLYATTHLLPSTDYHLQLLAHNLTFYQTWMASIRLAIRDGRVDELLARFLPQLSIPS